MKKYVRCEYVDKIDDIYDSGILNIDLYDELFAIRKKYTIFYAKKLLHECKDDFYIKLIVKANKSDFIKKAYISMPYTTNMSILYTTKINIVFIFENCDIEIKNKKHPCYCRYVLYNKKLKLKMKDDSSEIFRNEKMVSFKKIKELTNDEINEKNNNVNEEKFNSVEDIMFI